MPCQGNQALTPGTVEYPHLRVRFPVGRQKKTDGMFPISTRNSIQTNAWLVDASVAEYPASLNYQVTQV